MIDLHCHSYFSDGKLSPTELLGKAVQAGLQILALTDHDTVAGLDELHTAAHPHSIRIINGIEISTRWKKYDIHVIGLGIVLGEPGLETLIQQQNENRRTRAKAIATRLVPLGIEHAYEKACEIAGHERVGRPHFAQVIMNAGLVSDIQAAFKRFLAQGRPAYVPTPWVSIEQAVASITHAEGQAVLAHPSKYGLTRTKLRELIQSFKMAGGVGMEVVSGEMTELQLNELAGLCERFNLLASTGSDYHGEERSRVSLGQQRKLPLNCTPIWQQWNDEESV